MTLFRKTLLLATLAVAALSSAHAEDKNARAILNSTLTVEYLHTVMPPEIRNVLANIENGSYKRLAPELPMWIVEQISGTILYYQGQPEFKNQPASRLVDDQGSRFGERALTYGKASKSGWVNLVLAGKGYQAYCKSQYPFVTCTLAM